MRLYVKIIAAIFGLLVHSIPVIAQVNLDLYGLYSHTVNTPSSAGGLGLGLNFLADPGRSDSGMVFSPLSIQYGGGFYFSTFGSHTLSGIPLDSPQSGNADVTVSNALFGIQGMLRFVRTQQQSLYNPYMDLVLGARFMNSSELITPDRPQRGYERETDNTLFTTAGAYVGLSGGVQVKVANAAYLDLGLMLTHYTGSGRVLDVSSVQKSSNGYEYSLKSVPQDIVIVKVGVVIKLAKSKPRQYAVYNRAPSPPSYSKQRYDDQPEKVYIVEPIRPPAGYREPVRNYHPAPLKTTVIKPNAVRSTYVPGKQEREK